MFKSIEIKEFYYSNYDSAVNIEKIEKMCKKISWRIVYHKLIKTSKMLMLVVLKYTFLSIHKCRSLYVSTFSNVEMKIELELDMSHSTAS